MKRLLDNWKTTSAGLVMISGAVIHLVFQLRAHAASEADWNATFIAVMGGVGLIAAGDASQSQPPLTPKP